jgi:hypothetical protein
VAYRARQAQIRFIVPTRQAGIEFRADKFDAAPPLSFPETARFLYERFQHFQVQQIRAVILPCELIEQMARASKRYQQYADL